MVAAVVVLLALMVVPAPLLPPFALVGALQSTLGAGRAPAYLVAAIGLHAVFYGALGALAALAVDPGRTRRGRLVRLLVVPVVVVGVAVLLRSLKLGHWPMLENAVVPMAACALGTAVGLAFRQHGWRPTLAVVSTLAVLLAVLRWPGVDDGARRSVATVLQRFVAAGPTLPAGDERFLRLVHLAFAPAAGDAGAASAIEPNCAAILALGIVVGHERLSRYAGIDRDDPLVRAAVLLRRGASLHGREDWARHFCISAALAVAENAFVSDFGGLLKEEVDSLAKGSGFSFADLAADRAGVRFAVAATDSAAGSLAAQARLQAGVVMADVFPPVDDLAERLTVEQFRADYGGVGAPRYRAMLAAIDARLDGCAALGAR